MKWRDRPVESISKVIGRAVFCLVCIQNNFAESRCMFFPENIGIINDSIGIQRCDSGMDTIDLILRKWVPGRLRKVCSVGQYGTRRYGRPRFYGSDVGPKILDARLGMQHYLGCYVKCWRTPWINEVESQAKRVRGAEGKWINSGYPNPRTFVNLEVAAQVLPLKIRDDRVGDSSNNGYNLKSRFPPLKGLVPLLLGIGCLYFGWIPLREHRGNRFTSSLFIASFPLMIYGFLIVLPWSAP